ncbi:MAG: 2-hydroxyacyl-CoA dehydratase [Candidatus Helarchaeota archaeon]|nr:2-hydroxyacyl-CoA dehydratase [Candidatus Helarchaeota archaeon]
MIPKVDIQAVVGRLQEIKDDLGKKIIGVFPHSLIPDELIYAANAIPLKLTLGGDEYATTKGTEYLTQATCPFARGCIGYFDQGEPLYKFIDAYIGGNFCNGDLCGSEMITKFFKIPFLKVTFPTTTAPFSLKFLANEFLILKEHLEELTGTQITEETLLTAINKYNKVRVAFQELNRKMKDSNCPLLGTDLHNLMHQFLLLGPDDILDFIESLQVENNGSHRNRIPILISGSGIALRDELISFIEEFDAKVVVNDTWSGIHFYQNELEHNSNAQLMESLARHYLLKCESSRMVPNVRRIPRVKKLIEEYNIKGIIDHILKFCDPYVADYRRFKNALLEDDIPVLQLERDYATSLEQLRTRIGAFFEMIM